MLDVARCESGIRQFTSNGEVITSRTADRGLFQINPVHFKTAKSLGLDVDTVEGNIIYAWYLYQMNGLRDWSSSKSCWQKEVASIPYGGKV